MNWTLRPLDPDSPAEVTLVAQRMRDTLIEVEGEARGGSMYTLDWLEARVRWHLDPTQTTAEVLLATDERGAIVGHSIYRIESPAATPFGLVSTTYVLPAARQSGLAARLLDAAHRWFRAQGVDRACTWTSSTNAPLIALYRKFGYAITDQGANDLTGTLMVQLSVTPLPVPTGPAP